MGKNLEQGRRNGKVLRKCSVIVSFQRNHHLQAVQGQKLWVNMGL